MQVLSDMNLERNELQYAVIQNVSSDPTTNLKQGMVIYNTTSDKIKVYNGSKWITIASGNADNTTGITIDTSISNASTNSNAAGSKAVYDFVRSYNNKSTASVTQIESVPNGEILRKNASSGAIEGVEVDTTVTSGSKNLITSGAVYDFINNSGTTSSAANKAVVYNPALSSSNGKITWSISLDHKNKAFVQVYDNKTNELVFANVKDTSTSTITITLSNITGNLSSNSFYAVIIY